MAVNPYELQRQRISRQTEATGQQENEALKRRMARMGGLNSGAYLKASERLAGQQEQNKQAALEGIDIQEAAATEAKAESERGRQFSREERLGTQEFSAGETLKGREFARGERISAQDFARGQLASQQEFAKGQSEAAQTFAKGEREASQTFATGERTGAEDYAKKEAQKAREQQQSQFDKQFAADQDINKFNQVIASIQAGASSEDIRQWVQALFQGGDKISPLAYQFQTKPAPPQLGYPTTGTTGGRRGGGAERGGSGGGLGGGNLGGRGR